VHHEVDTAEDRNTRRRGVQRGGSWNGHSEPDGMQLLEQVSVFINFEA